MVDTWHSREARFLLADNYRLMARGVNQKLHLANLLQVQEPERGTLDSALQLENPQEHLRFPHGEKTMVLKNDRFLVTEVADNSLGLFCSENHTSEVRI